MGDLVWDDERVTWGKKVRFGSLTSIDLKEFRYWIEKNKIELVLFNEQHWWPPVLLCNELGVKTGAYVDYYTEQTLPFFACYDFVICNTRRHQCAFEWHSQCLYLPWGTDLNLFKSESFSPVNDKCVTFFHSSGMSPERKGTDLVIKAFAEISHVAKLVIHSQRPLKTYFSSLASLILKLETSGRLICHEETVPAPGLYHLGDVYVYPTRLEGIGLTIIESLACGLPVIVPDNPPMNEFVEDNPNSKLVTIERQVSRADGYYWPQCFINLKSLQKQMEYYVDNSQQLEAFKMGSRQYAEEKFDWSRNACSLAEYLAKVPKKPTEELNAIKEDILKFEKQRMTLAQRYPTMFNLKRLVCDSLRF
jgi:glycosyltransferase involved in cell wall biosynthesis